MYQTSRSILAFVELVAWLIIGAGLVMAIAAAGVASNSGFGRAPAGAIALAAMPGIICSVIGVMIVVLVQMARANLDIADMTRSLLDLSRKQLDAIKSSEMQMAASLLSTPGPAQRRSAQKTNTEQGSKSDTPRTNRLNKSGTKPLAIERYAGLYLVEGKEFQTEEAAVRYLNSRT